MVSPVWVGFLCQCPSTAHLLMARWLRQVLGVLEHKAALKTVLELGFCALSLLSALLDHNNQQIALQRLRIFT